MIKARYVAQIECDFEVEENDNTLPFCTIRDNVTNNFTPVLQEHLQEDLSGALGKAKVKVTQMYADAWRVEDDLINKQTSGD